MVNTYKIFEYSSYYNLVPYESIYKVRQKKFMHWKTVFKTSEYIKACLFIENAKFEEKAHQYMLNASKLIDEYENKFNG